MLRTRPKRFLRLNPTSASRDFPCADFSHVRLMPAFSKKLKNQLDQIKIPCQKEALASAFLSISNWSDRSLWIEGLSPADKWQSLPVSPWDWKNLPSSTIGWGFHLIWKEVHLWAASIEISPQWLSLFGQCCRPRISLPYFHWNPKTTISALSTCIWASFRSAL
jgi:hypothetical protein